MESSQRETTEQISEMSEKLGQQTTAIEELKVYTKPFYMNQAMNKDS